MKEARLHSGKRFAPRLAEAFEAVAPFDRFWQQLAAPDINEAVFALEPLPHELPLEEDDLDDIAQAFGQVVDSKRPYTSGRNARVALYTDLVAETMGLAVQRPSG